MNEATGSRASHNFLDYALAHFATGKTKNSKLRAKMKKRISAAKVLSRSLSCSMEGVSERI